jgi:hypothetical protein
MLLFYLFLAFQVPDFERHELASDLRGGYQVLPADLNGDGRVDLIALASGMSELVWFENPGTPGAPWPRYILGSGFKQLINIAAWQSGPGKIPQLLVAHEFSNIPENSKGSVSLLEANNDPKTPWRRKDIEDRSTSHRLKVANARFVNAPLANEEAVPPDYKGVVPLVEYDSELSPKLISAAEQGVMHGLSIGDFNGDGRDDIFTAAFTGIAVYIAQKNGTYRRQFIDSGSREAWPRSGASEVVAVRLTPGAKTVTTIATIEPWHGNQLVIMNKSGKDWKRTVLDTSFEEGHALVAVDLNGDGRDEIIYGARKAGGTLRIAYWDPQRKHWQTKTLESGTIAVNSCASFDADGDGRPDFACIGGATQNLVLFRNKAR